jgi:imidazolonepropionase-like amidohydrolase
MRRPRSTGWTSWAVSACLAIALLAGRDLRAEAPPPFVIRNVRVFDGERLLPPRDVAVTGGLIQAVGPNLEVAPGTVEVSAADGTLLPGLIDAHTHDWGESPKQALRFGVTTELNMSGPPPYIAGLRRAEEEGRASDAASVLSAGHVVTPAGGHGTQFGLSVPTLAGLREVPAFVDARLAEGSDYVKVIFEDGRGCGREFAALSEAELAAAVEAAHARGTRAIVHVTSQPAARTAIAARADGLAHLFADRAPGPELAASMRGTGAFAITTLSVLSTTLGSPVGPALSEDPRLSPFLSAAARAQMNAPPPFRCDGQLANAFAAVRELHAAGVPLLAGTDAPAPGSWNGASLHGELALLVQAGLSPSEALAAATSVPAAAFRLQDRGRIAPGRRADLLLVRGDPTRDVTATRDIVAVWKAGARLTR